MEASSPADPPAGAIADLVWNRPAIGEITPLRGSRCSGCARVQFPHTGRCPVCGQASDAIPLGPRARLGHCTAVLHPPPGARVPVPYVVGVAQFEEGISVLGVVLVDELDQVDYGDRVEVVVSAPAPDFLVYAYRPVVDTHE